MANLPNPFISADLTPRSADQAPTSSPCPHSDVGAEAFDLPEPPPLCLTTPHPEMDRELEAILNVIIAGRTRRAA